MNEVSTPSRRSHASLLFVGLALFAYFGAWALLRPPLQSPDEPQHLLKTGSVLRQPWVSPPGRFVLDARYVNPLALETPPELDKLFFRPVNTMTGPDIARARSHPWLDRARPLADYERAIASYPTPYYLVLFGLSEPITRQFGLTPYQATYAARLVSALLAALLWAVVWSALRGMSDLGVPPGPVFALVVMNPMLAFMSSAVNPDAVNNPLCALALLQVWRVAATGRGRTAAVVSLLAALLTKPAGLQLVPVLAAVIGALTLMRRIDRRRAATAVALVAGAGLVAVLAFYLWSPPRFLGAGPSPDSWRQYLAVRTGLAGLAWRMYWGQLGWLDYAAANVWYWLIGLMVLANVLSVVLRPLRGYAIGWYLGLSWLAFAIVTLAGEYWYLDSAGYTFQGRYVFPAALGAGALFFHRVPLARHGLLAALVALNLALVHQTVLRYYADRWIGLWQAMPF